MSINPTHVNQRKQSGFTLLELVAIIAIIAVLIGLLLPAIQKAREAANKEKASNHLRLIQAAQKSFFNTHGVYSSSLDDLGLGGEFQCSDPACSSRQNNGYFFQISLTPSDETFTAVATPAVIGKTGSAKCLVQASPGPVQCAPIDGAGDVTEDMFAHIRDRAIPTLAQSVLQRPSDLSEIARRLESPDTTPEAFGNLDVNGDGRVTFTDLQTYNGIGADVINPFIAIIDQEMQLGAGGEEVSSLPGVTFEMLEAISGPFDTSSGAVRTQISGLSEASQPSFTNPAGSSAINLSGFADGSVRFVKGNGDGHQGTLTSRINGGSFFAHLNPSNAANPNVWGGTFSLSDVNEDGVNGILIGVIRTPDPTSSRRTLDGLIIATYGEGILSCEGGTGDVTINWGDQNFNGPFQADFHLLAAIQKKTKQ